MTGMARARTPFVETEILLAVLDEDVDRAKDLLRGMLPGELRRFQLQLKRTRELTFYVEAEQS